MDLSVQMSVTNSRHMVTAPGVVQGADINELHRMLGVEPASGGESFQSVMLRALDGVSASQQNASRLQQEAIVNPSAMDIHDITIAQAQARMHLDIAASVMNRVVQSWRDLINTR